MNKAVAIDFALCADRERNEAVRPVVEQATAFALDQVRAHRLEALILTGSLARGEGSVLLRPDGFRLLGDVELLVILGAPFDWRQARREMVELSERATREFGDDGRVASIEYGPAGITYLKRSIRPSIFAYDLLCDAKVVWGRADIVSEIRPFGVEAIPREEGVKLIMNRFIELLIGEELRPKGPDAEARAYRLVKTTLDLAGSALAFAGQFVSRYANRQLPFGTFLASSPDLRRALRDADGYLGELELATRCKLAPTDDLLLRGDLAKRVASTLAWAKGFWLWEMQQLLGYAAGYFPELVEAYLRREPLLQRLKGWVKYCRHPLRPRSTLSPLRMARLCLRGSPHSLAYAAALLAHAGMTEGQEDWELRAASLLPIPVRTESGAVVRQVGELWRWLIRNN